MYVWGFFVFYLLFLSCLFSFAVYFLMFIFCSTYSPQMFLWKCESKSVSEIARTPLLVWKCIRTVLMKVWVTRSTLLIVMNGFACNMNLCWSLTLLTFSSRAFLVLPPSSSVTTQNNLSGFSLTLVFPGRTVEVRHQAVWAGETKHSGSWKEAGLGAQTSSVGSGMWSGERRGRNLDQKA